MPINVKVEGSISVAVSYIGPEPIPEQVRRAIAALEKVVEDLNAMHRAAAARRSIINPETT